MPDVAPDEDASIFIRSYLPGPADQGVTGRSKRFPSSTTSTRSSNEIVDELEALGYVTRRPDLKDRRAKLITLTVRGQAAVAAGESTITGIEDDIVKILGADGARNCARC